MDHQIGVVPFSPIASGFLSGKVTAATDFSHSDDVRKYVPQLRKENMAANQPVLDLLTHYAEGRNATKAQIALSWMLHKYPGVVPIPGSKNQERILENLGAWNVNLTKDEFAALEAALEQIPVHGHRGFVEHFNEHYTIDELSERFDLSPTVMKKCFRGVYGDSVYAYMKRYRLQMAERLLKESGLTIGEIAAQIGYLNPNKYTSAFVRNTGCRQQNIEKKSEWIENSPLSHCN